MPRKPRIIAQGKSHHCYSRCHGKRNLLRSSHCKRYLIEAIRMCQNKYHFELIAAEPVDNHIHLVIRTLDDRETISKIMQYIKARIAEKYNRATGETGAFWNERFGSKVIEDCDNPQEYLLKLLWYIGYNPVKKGLSSNPRDNYIGFINSYLTKNHISPVAITLHPYFTTLADTFELCVQKFLLYEDAYLMRL